MRNVLFIMADQLRHDHMGCAGHPCLRTPNLDALAARGTRFTNAFVQSGICGPSRMSYYTGRFVSSHGATHNRVPLSVGEVTLGWHLRQSGRKLALAGKTHVVPDRHGMARLQVDGAPSPSGAGEAGDDELAVLLREGWFELVDRHDGHHAEPGGAYAAWLRARGYDSADPWSDFVISVTDEAGTTQSGWHMRHARHPARVAREHSETAYTTDRALEFIEAQESAPWVLHLSYVKPHWPYIAPAPYHAMYTPAQCLPVQRHPAERGAHPVQTAFMDEEVAKSFQQQGCIDAVRPAYQGLITELDDHLGRVWAMLDRLDLWRDTLVIFCADHGDYLGDHWLGEKELFHDCIQKVPFLLWDPDAAHRRPAAERPGVVEDRPVMAIDVVPTILDALGLPPAPHLVEGRSLLDLTRGRGVPWRDAVFSELDWTFRGARRRLRLPVGQHQAWMVRTATWKYIHWSSGMPSQLFDLTSDPAEFFDLGQDPAHEATRSAMRARLLDWFGSLKRRTTITWEEAERGTDNHKAAGVFFGQW